MPHSFGVTGVLFVCVEVLRPSQPNGVMWSAVVTGVTDQYLCQHLQLPCHKKVPICAWHKFSAITTLGRTLTSCLKELVIVERLV